MASHLADNEVLYIYIQNALKTERKKKSIFDSVTTAFDSFSQVTLVLMIQHSHLKKHNISSHVHFDFECT